jgi:hypothetical protein
MSVQLLTKPKNKKTFILYSNIIDCNILKVNNLKIDNLNFSDIIIDVYEKITSLQNENIKLKLIIDNLTNIKI